ncbi:MAG: hypothetical protein WC373_05200 [Smithella sp.]
MKTAKELYPDILDKEDGYFFSTGDYEPILKSFGEVKIQVDDKDYQGDSRVLYKKDNKYGYLQFGWGSCSGCDALQACDSYKAIDDLICQLNESIKWFDSKEEALKFFQSHDWDGDYSTNSEEQKQFVLQCIKELSA